MSNSAILSPTLDDASVVKSYMDSGLTCTDIDKCLDKFDGWAKSVIVWWWALPAEDGGMPDIDEEFLD